MVAAAKLRKSQERIIQMRPFAEKLSHILKNLSAAQNGNDSDNWYSQPRADKKILIIVVSADRGLCGSFNSNVFKSVSRLIQEKYQEQNAQGDVTILAIGRKANDFYGKRKMNVIDSYVNLFQGLSFNRVSETMEFVMTAFKDGKFDKVELVYNEFRNVATQILRIEQLLPILPAETETKVTEVDYIYQPNQDEIVTGLIPKSLKIQLYKALIDSDAAFNGAQMTAMDKATENAGELLKEYKLMYNRTRQAAITKEILEIVAGAEALKSA